MTEATRAPRLDMDPGFSSGKLLALAVLLLLTLAAVLFTNSGQVCLFSRDSSRHEKAVRSSSNAIIQEIADRLMRVDQQPGRVKSESEESSSKGSRVARLTRHLSRIADRDTSGEVSPDEAEWLSSTINGTLMAAAAATQVGDDPKILSRKIGLSEPELTKILDDFYQIEGKLRLQCDGYVPVSPRRLHLNSIIGFPDHWQHHPEQGIDSEAGCFLSEDPDLTIIYDIGDAAGEFVRECAQSATDWLFVDRFDGVVFRYSRSGEFFAITIPDEGPANYVAKVKSHEETEYVLELISRYRSELLRLEPEQDSLKTIVCDL